MSYIGDIRLEKTIDLKFTSRRFTTGAPFALAGGTISAYVDNGTTQITAGITLTADFDTVTGLNHVRVVATAANGYTAPTNVDLVITAGTVDSVSVVGEVIGSFSIEARSAMMPTTADRTLNVLSGRADANLEMVNDTLVTATAGRPEVIVNSFTAGAITAAAIATDAIDADALAADAVSEIQSGLATAAALTTVDDFLDTEIAAIKAKTDSLTFTVAGQVDSNIQYVNDVLVTGNGQAGTEWGP